MVGEVFLRIRREDKQMAVMIINSFDGKVYRRDVWGINKGDHFYLYIDDDITSDEFAYLFKYNDFIMLKINDIDDSLKRNAVEFLFKSVVERRS